MEKLKSYKTFVLLLTGLVSLQVHAIYPVPEKDMNLSAPPIIIWTSPVKEYSILKTNKVTIKATIKSITGVKLIQVYVNDFLYGEPEMSPSLTERGSFIVTKTMILEPGDNSVYLVANNDDGSVKSDKRYFTVPFPVSSNDTAALSSTAPPVIVWSDPVRVRTNLNSQKTSIKATIRSSIGISSVVLYLNDIIYGEPEMTPSLTEVGSFLIQKAITFEPGEDSIYLVASSPRGTTISDKRYFSIPAPAKVGDPLANVPVGAPVISWTDPMRTRSALSSAKTEIQATIRSASGVRSVVVYLNGVIYGEPEMVPSTTEVGSFIVSKTVNLVPGQDSIYFIASNNSGTTTSEKRYFTVPLTVRADDSSAFSVIPVPTIAWAVPTVRSTTLRSAGTNVKATIKSESPLTTVLLYMNGVPLGETNFKPSGTDAQSYVLEQNLSFKQIENNIYIEARNSGGNTRSEARIFICPPSSLAANQPVNQNVPKAGDTGPVNQQVVSKQAEQPMTVPAQQVSSRPIASPEAPVITWTSPSGANTTLETYNATVKANVKSTSGLKSVLLYINGISKGETDIKLLPNEAGTFQIEKNINFGPGENQIYLVATNTEGASKSEVRYFSNPLAIAPVITWSNPEIPNTLVNTESLTISACIKSPTDLKSVRLLVNGSIFSEDNVFQTSGSGDCNYSWKGSVVLRTGDNSIFITATNVAGSTTSEKRIIKYEAALAEKRLALIIGNSQYRNSAPLKNPVNDANLMEATLKDLGFEVIKRLDAGFSDMRTAIREFEEKLPDFNIALFYYAGHGNQVDGKNYLIPVDAKLEKPGDCKFEAIEVNFIVDEFERYQDNTNIVILDACRNNPFAAWARGGEQGFRAMSFTSGTVVAYATSEGTTAADGKGANGLYTEELVKQMILPQSLNDVFMNTRVQVRKLSNNLQVPSETNKLNGPFYFRK